jgi:uncharacterized protein (TIGR03000 family)
MAGMNSGASLGARTGLTTGFSSSYNPTVRNDVPLIGSPNTYFPSQTTSFSTAPLFPYSSRTFPYGYGFTAREPIDEYPKKPVPFREAAPIDGSVATMNVHVPANAEIWFEGTKTGQSGDLRTFVSPPLESGRGFSYEVRARWTENGKEVDQTRKVSVHAGERVNVDFSAKK